jgi:transposase-like protein
MWGRKPPGLGQERKNREAASNQPLHEPGSSDRNRTYTGEKGICPYCGSENSTPIKGNDRAHCNACFNSFSPTVGTEYHKSYLSKEQRDKLKECAREGMGVTQTAKAVGVNRNTVSRYFQIYEEKGGRQLAEVMERDSVEVRQQKAFKQLEQELLDEQD